jgi:hypothetical protein
MGLLDSSPMFFDNPPGTDGYRPLRSVLIVTWKNEKGARQLKSAADIKVAEKAGEITIEKPGVGVCEIPWCR